MLSDKKVLFNIWEEKRNPGAITDLWLKVFTNPVVMEKIILQMHVFDIINLARTCRYLYTFYYGNMRMAEVLRQVVKRDLNAEFKRKHPLKHLGNMRNTKQLINCKSSAQENRGRRNILCASCSHIETYNYENQGKYVLCWNCNQGSIHFRGNVYPELMAICINRFDRSCLPRISRFVKRFSFKYNNSLNRRAVVGIIYNRVLQLDLPLRITPPSWIMETISTVVKKREREEDPYAGVILYIHRERIGFEDACFLRDIYNINNAFKC